jgi:hypothetical protein
LVPPQNISAELAAPLQELATSLPPMRHRRYLLRLSQPWRGHMKERPGSKNPR